MAESLRLASLWACHARSCRSSAAISPLTVMTWRINISKAVRAIGRRAFSYVDAPFGKAFVAVGFDRLLSYVRPVCAA